MDRYVAIATECGTNGILDRDKLLVAPFGRYPLVALQKYADDLNRGDDLELSWDAAEQYEINDRDYLSSIRPGLLFR